MSRATHEFRFGAQGAELQRYMRERARVTFIRGPLGSGKTFGSCQRVFTQMCEQKPNSEGVRKSRWVAVRNTYPDLQGTTIKDWLELFGDPKLGKFNNDYPPTHRLNFKLSDGTTVQAEMVFMALDRPDSVRKLRGLQATGFWLNEVKELDWDIIQMCDLRHGRYPSKAEVQGYWHGMIGDTNSPDDSHWYYRLAEEERPKNWVFITQPGGVIRTEQGWRENPKAENLANLPDGYYENGMAGKDDEWIAVNLGNEYGHITDGKPIYKGQWNDVVHVSEFPLLPVKDAQFYLGFDFGLTPACIIGQMVHGQLRILDEVVSESMGIEFFLDEMLIPLLKDKYSKFTIADMIACCDPSGVSRNDVTGISPIATLQQKGFDAYGAHTNAPTERWEAVRWFLTRKDRSGAPLFLLDRDCRVLRRGFNGGYQLRRLQVGGTAKYAGKADKNEWSHPHDALQYLCLAARGEVLNPLPTTPMNANYKATTRAGY